MLGGRSQAAGRGPWGLRRDLGKVLGKGLGEGPWGWGEFARGPGKRQG